jgi:autotransporter-associated beta strand protein
VVQNSASSLLILSGVNTYTGPTTVSRGTLVVSGSLSGTLSTAVTNATLAGTGFIANGVTIGNGLGATSSARVAPGTDGTIGTLTTGGVSISSDGAYKFDLNSTANTADKLVANTVNLNGASQFLFTDIGSGALLALGRSFTVIDNTGLGAIVGTFGNLAQNSIFTSGLNTFQANYLGGTGNDLVLVTGVPEPSAALMLLSGMGLLLGLQRFRRTVRG